MAVLIVAEVEGQTAEAYDQMMVVLRPLLDEAPGFVAQGGGPTRHAWRVFEVWESLDDATRFYATHVRPALPSGVTPARTVVELRNLILASAGAVTVAQPSEELEPPREQPDGALLP